MTVEDRADALAERRRSELAELSKAMVALYKELFGRGPTKARSDYAGPDVVLCTLEDSLTPVEHALRDLGEVGRLRDIRALFQYSTSDRFTEAVEGIFGRRVRSFISGMDVENDVSAELFYFEPRDEPATAGDRSG